MWLCFDRTRSSYKSKCKDGINGAICIILQKQRAAITFSFSAV